MDWIWIITIVLVILLAILLAGRMTEKRISSLEVHFEYLSSNFRNQRDEMSAIKTQLNNAISTIRNQESLVSTLQTRFSSGIANLQSNLEKKISVLRDQIETIHSTSYAQQETHVSTSDEPPELNSLTLQSQMETLISTSHAELKSQITVLQNKVDNRRSYLDVQLKTIRHASHGQFEHSSLPDMLEKKTSDLKAQLETINSKSNSQICALENAMVNKSLDLQTQIETIRSTLQEQRASQFSTLQKELENKISDIYTKLEIIHSTSHSPSCPLEKKMEKLQTEMETILPDCMDQLDIKMSTLRNDLERTTSRLQEQLSDDKTVVGFTARVDQKIHNLAQHKTVYFRDVVTNIGEAYNPHTGLFTCPIYGMYHFSWTTISLDGSHVNTELHVSGEWKLATVSDNDETCCSGSGVFQLIEGETVCIKTSQVEVVKIDHEYSSFSGHLIRKM